MGASLVNGNSTTAQETTAQETTAQETIVQEAKDQDSGTIPAPARASQPRSPSIESIEQLSRQDYSQRQRATMEMWRRRDESRDIVQRAARDPDPEIAGRAQWILKQWRRGALPDTPPEISRLLQKGDQPEAIQRLLEAGQFLAAVVAVEESAGTVDRENIQRRLSAAMLRRFPVYVHKAIENEAMPEFLRLVDLVAESPEMALSRIQIMRHLGLPITGETLLPSNAVMNSRLQRDQITALVLCWLGRFDEAVDMAADGASPELLLDCQMMAGRWDQIAKSASESARQSVPGSSSQIRYWSQAMIGADRAGDTATFESALANLRMPTDPQQLPIDGLSAGWRWRTLAIHGQVDAAFEILDKIEPDTSASVAIDGSRYQRVFAGLDLSLQDIDAKYRLWADEAVESQAFANLDQLTPAVRRVLVVIQCLLAVGRDDVAWPMAKRLCEADVLVGSHPLREYVLSNLVTTKRNDWVIQLAMQPGGDPLSPVSHDTVARTLPDCDATTLETMIDAYSQLFPELTSLEHFRRSCELIAGQIPAGFDPEVDFRRLCDVFVTPRPIRINRRTMRPMRQIPANLNLVQMLVRHGEGDLANECLTRLVQSGNTEALFQSGEQALDAAGIDEASSILNSVVDQIASVGGTSGTDDVSLFGKARIGQWIAARRSGDVETADRLLAEIRLMLCTPSASTRLTLASYLAERGETDLAIKAYEDLLPMKVFASDDAIEFYKVARAYALIARESKPDQASRWFDMAVVRAVESDDFRAGAFVTLPVYVRRWSIEAALAGGDRDAVAKHIDRLLELDPLDIDLAERLLPELRKESMDALADDALDRIMDRGLRHVETFTFDAMVRNNLAWVAAMNKRRLSEAQRLSEQAVRIEPDSAIYRDTLAEVLFLRDDVQTALQIERGCLLDDPGQWHLHQQVERFEKALEEAASAD